MDEKTNVQLFELACGWQVNILFTTSDFIKYSLQRKL